MISEKVKKSPHKYNLPMYREALKRVKRGKAGVYPLIDWQGNLMFYVMHRNQERLRGMCMKFLKCPTYFIKHKRRTKGFPRKFYYVILMGFHAEQWHRRMKFGNEKWRWV